MLAHLRYAARTLRRSPGFTALAVLTIGLGLGATTAIVSVLDAVVLEPLPWPQPESRAMVWSRWRNFEKTWVNPFEMTYYAQLHGRMRVGSGEERPWVTVVGIVRDVKHTSLVASVKPKFYRPLEQFHIPTGSVTRNVNLVVRASGDPLALAPQVRDLVRSRWNP